ncbi:MAG: aminotransferase class V-fold PLP-dependent enzyme, partial [Armatimonadota bacterium]|nr:aminotransferase class V-fold PLP-dependent enzyme [Armatimonadota bacterium]
GSGGAGGTLPNILNVGFRGVRAETLLLGLDLEGVAASSGSACASGSIEPSHVLKAIGLSPEEANSSLRFSVGWTTSAAEIDRAAVIVERVVARARR